MIGWMLNFLSEIFRSDLLKEGPSRAWRWIFFALIGLQLAALIPMAEDFPRSAVAPALAVAFIALLNILVLSTAQAEWRVFLQVAILLLTTSALVVAIEPDIGVSLGVRSIIVASCCVLALGLAWGRLGSAALNWALAAQQFALCATLLSWLAVEPIRLSESFDQMMARGHFHAGMRALFAAPLVLGCVVALASLAKVKSPAIALCSICAGQYGIGCIELGVALRNDAIVGLGAAAGLSMIPILLFARVRARAEKAGMASA